MSSTLQ